MVDTCFQGHRIYLYTLLMKIHQELMDASTGWLDVLDFDAINNAIKCFASSSSLSLSLPSSSLAFFPLYSSLMAAYWFSLLEDCILASRALGDQVELLCKVLPSWPLLFQQKECYASCIWTSSGIQCAGSLIAHYQLLSHTDFSFAPRNWVILLSCESWFVGYGSRPCTHKYPLIECTTKWTRCTHAQ